MASNIPIIVQGNSFSLAIPLQIYYINGGQMDLQDYTPDRTDEVSVQLKGSRRNYTYTPTIDGNVANIDLSGNELADNYSVVVSIVKANGQRLRSFRTDQFFIVESSDDLTTDDIIQGLEENVIYLNSSIFVAGEDGRGIESIVKTATAGLVDTYTITYSDNTTSTFNVTNGAAGAQGADGVGITSIEKTATVGLVDTYTITLSNGQTSTFEVTNGRDGHDLGLAVIVDDLTTGGHEDALSAEMGKVIAEKTLTPVESDTETFVVTMEQGGFNSTTKMPDQTTDATHPCRVRSAGLLQVFGTFTVTVKSGFSCTVYYYPSNDYSTYEGQSEWFTGTKNLNHAGWVSLLTKDSNNGARNFTPADITVQMTRTMPSTYAPRIKDNLTSDDTDFALSAKQGKVLGDALFGGTITPALEQGTIKSADGTKWDDAGEATKAKRVRVVDFIKVDGDFTATVTAGHQMKLFYYTSADASTFVSTDNWVASPYSGNFSGYIMMCYKRDDDGNFTPSEIEVTVTRQGLEGRVSIIEASTPNPATFDREYVGELIKVGNNKFKQSAYKTLARNLSQAMAIYGDYILLFAYATNSSTAYLYKLSDNTLLATLTLPNSTYKRPHCNAVSFGVTFNSANSILPLMYVSQWDNDSQKGCLVYDITLSGGTYSASLAQAILPTNVNTATRGAGQTDWVVDPNGFIYSIGYLLNDGAHTLPNNKTMIAKYKLPAISDGAEIVFGDADVIDHFDMPIYIYRQDAIFENGRILMLAGMTGAVDRRLLAIDPVAKQIVSLVSLDYINKEPEGLGVTDGKLLVGFNGDAVIYRFEFI